jgi:capsular polysaccharide transport system ATP-binding protein
VVILEDVVKRYQTRHGDITVLNGIALQVKPGEKVGIFGRNGAGKSTLIRLISGAERPSSGSIRRLMGVSWPLAFSGGFQGSLTGLDNLRFICRVYGVSVEDKLGFVEEFSELGRFMREPIKTYSAGMKARLAFALSMAIEFDCFLIDEVITVGDSRFYEKCQHELFAKRRDRSLIIVSHVLPYIKQYCDTAYVLHEGELKGFEDIDGAYRFYSEA